MKRAYLLYAVIVATFLLVAGCGGSSGKNIDDPPTKAACEGNAVHDDEDNCVLCGTDEIVVDDKCVVEDESDPPPPKKVAAVKIKTSVRTGCVYKKDDCGGTVSATGGSGKYKWTLNEGTLPAGVEFTAPGPDTTDSRKGTITMTTDSMTGPDAPVLVKIVVEDAAEAERNAEAALTFTVNDSINITASKVASDNKVTPITISGGTSADIAVEYESTLKFEVSGNGKTYTWSIDSKKMKCYKDADFHKNPDECRNGAGDGLLSIAADPANNKVAALGVRDSHKGYLFEGAVLTAKDEIGNIIDVKIPSLVFADACKSPIVIEKPAISIQRNIDSPFGATFKVLSGGKKPYKWSFVPKTWPSELEFQRVRGIKLGGDSYALTGDIVATDRLRIDQIRAPNSLSASYEVEVKDACAAPNSAKGTVNIIIRDGDDSPGNPSVVEKMPMMRARIKIGDVSWEGDSRVVISLASVLLDEGLGAFLLDTKNLDGGNRTVEKSIDQDSAAPYDIGIDQIDKVEISFRGSNGFDFDLQEVSLLTDNWNARFADDSNKYDKGVNGAVIDDRGRKLRTDQMLIGFNESPNGVRYRTENRPVGDGISILDKPMKIWSLAGKVDIESKVPWCSLSCRDVARNGAVVGFNYATSDRNGHRVMTGISLRCGYLTRHGLVYSADPATEDDQNESAATSACGPSNPVNTQFIPPGAVATGFKGSADENVILDEFALVGGKLDLRHDPQIKKLDETYPAVAGVGAQAYGDRCPDGYVLTGLTYLANGDGVVGLRRYICTEIQKHKLAPQFERIYTDQVMQIRDIHN